MYNLGELIRRLRETKGLSQAKLGQLVGISQQYIHQIETGDISRPSNDLLSRFANALGVDIRTLAETAVSGYPDKETPDGLLAKLQILMPIRIPVLTDLRVSEEITEYVYVAREKAVSRNLIGVRVQGYCMESEGIFEGDTLIIDKDASLEIGKSVLCYDKGQSVPRFIHYKTPADLEGCEVYGVVIEINRKL